MSEYQPAVIKTILPQIEYLTPSTDYNVINTLEKHDHLIPLNSLYRFLLYTIYKSSCNFSEETSSVRLSEQEWIERDSFRYAGRNRRVPNA